MAKALTYVVRSGLVLFCVATVMLHFLSPEVDPIAKGISYYALGKFGWLFTLSLLFVGLACVAVVGLLWRRCPTQSGRFGLLLLIVWAVLLEAGAIFEMDGPGHVRTLSGRIHSVAGSSFLLLPPAAFLISSSFSRLYPLDPQRGLWWILAWCVLIASGLLITFNGFLLSPGVGGLAQRAYWATIVVWFFFLAQPKTNELQPGFQETMATPPP
jgi:hypothetical protein